LEPKLEGKTVDGAAVRELGLVDLIGFRRVKDKRQKRDRARRLKSAKREHKNEK